MRLQMNHSLQKRNYIVIMVIDLADKDCGKKGQLFTNTCEISIINVFIFKIISL